MAIGIHQTGEHTYTVTVNDLHQIHTTITANPDEVSRWIDSIDRLHGLHGPFVGLDVKWRHADDPFINPVAILQLCIGHQCLIFQVLQAGGCIPYALRYFLSDDIRYTFLGVGIEEGAQKLNSQYGLKVSRTVDIGTYAANRSGRADLRQARLSALANTVLGFAVEEPQHVRLGRWDDALLSLDQIKHACADAFVSLQIGKKIIHDLWIG